MKIGGLQKLTLVDYPNKIAATVFLTGCNFKCGFCHNPSLVDVKRRTDLRNYGGLSSVEFFDFLKSKQGLIDGICVTGGEPTINSNLVEFIKRIKELNFSIKLDTNGSNPEMLQELIKQKLLDFIAMDIKTSVDVKNPKSHAYRQAGKIQNSKYDKATGTNVNIENIMKSVEIIKNSKIDYEFRTTVVPGIVNREDIERIGKWLKGVKKFSLQQFRNQKVLNKEFEKVIPYRDDTLKEFKKILEKYIKNVELRI
ncbi:MAG: anaerobic ribonucleoside-triphosphate reductase activating protein [Patescibacteria group bacterium]